MKKKLFQVKSSLELKMQKLTEKELSFITGGAESAAGSSGSGSGTCNVHCCFKDIVIQCH